MLIELHYKICVADSWEDRFNKSFEVKTAVYDKNDSSKVESTCTACVSHVYRYIQAPLQRELH